MRFRISLAFVVAAIVLFGTGIRAAYERFVPRDATDVPRVVMLDVGQGDAIIIDGPGDAEVLIDGGPSPDLPQKIARFLGRDRSINLIVLTHPHADHLVGLVPVLERYTIGRILMTGVLHTTNEYERFLAIIRDKGIPTTIAAVGQSYDIGPTRLKILAPAESFAGARIEDLNESSIVMMAMIDKNPNVKIQISNQIQNPNNNTRDVQLFRMLFTGDAGSDIEAKLIEQYCPVNQSPCPALAADILKVGHHGSQTASSAEFLDAVQPTHAFVSAGRNNDYGHPHARTLKRLERAGAQIWRTDRNGTIIANVTPDGLSVRAER